MNDIWSICIRWGGVCQVNQQKRAKKQNLKKKDVKTAQKLPKSEIHDGENSPEFRGDDLWSTLKRIRRSMAKKSAKKS